MTQTAALQKTNGNQALAKQFEVEESFIETVKNTIAKGASDTELQLFLQTAKRTGLDPMARQIFCVSRYDSKAGREVMSIQISIDGFRAIADRTGKYVPSREPTYTFDKQGNLESATAYIKKFVAGAWHEVAATAFYPEYVQTTKDGKPNRMWTKMPRLMLAKTAESLVLRKAFPAELSGLYTDTEMGTESAEKHAPETIPAADHPVKSMSPEEVSLRLELEELCRSLEIPTKSVNAALAKFDALSTLEEKESAVAKARDKAEVKEKETVIAIISEKLSEMSEEDSEAFFVEEEIVGGLQELSIERLRQLQEKVTAEPIEGTVDE